MNDKGWNDGNKMVAVLCCAVHTGAQSQSRSVKSLGGGSKSKTPSHGCAGDNAALPGSPTTWRVLLCSRYFVTEAGTLKNIKVSLSCGTWTFMCNIERKLTRVNQVWCVFILLTHVNQVRYVFILLTKSLKFKFFLWLVFTLFCDT